MTSQQAKRLSHEERAQLRSDMAHEVREGATINETARKFNCTRNTVNEACRTFDVIPTTEIGTGKKDGQSFTVLKALIDGKVHANIARECHCSRQYIGQIRDKAEKAGFKFKIKNPLDKRLKNH